MLVRCHWCQGLFEPERPGRQRCPKCGSELDVPEPELPPVAPDEEGPGPGGWQQPPPRGAHGHEPHDSPGHHEPGPGGWQQPPPLGGHGQDPHGPPHGYPYAPYQRMEEPSPWERSAELGIFRGLVETWKRATLHPTAFFRKLARRPLAPAFVYGWLMGGIGIGFQSIWLATQDLVGGELSGVAVAPFAFLAGLAISAISLWVNSFILHVGCLLLGCGGRGFEATFRAVAYAQGAQVFSAVPVAGSFVAAIWTLSATVIGVREMQETTTWRVVLAMFLPALVVLFLLFALVALAMVIIGMGSA